MAASGGDCVFCAIVAGRAPASVVWSDDTVLAFLSLQQHRPGHTLVIPKRHFATIYDLEEALAGPLLTVTARLARAIKREFRPDGILIRQNNEAAAGQVVFHVHLHVIPREVGALYAGVERPRSSPREELDGYAARIRRALDDLGLSDPPATE